MSDAEDSPPAAEAEVAAPIAAKKKTKSKSKSTDHPRYRDMIKCALTADKGKCSRQLISHYIISNYKVDEKYHKNHLKLALRAGVKNGTLKQIKGVGASGSFRLGDAKDGKAKKEKPKSPKTKKAPQKSEKKAKKVKKPKTDKKPKSKPSKKVKVVKKSPAKKSTKTKKTKSPKKDAKKD